MGPGELWGKWSEDGDRVHVLGTKRETRNRLIPNLGELCRPQRRYRAFQMALAKASHEMVEPYDGRRTFAHWMEMAGIPRTRRRLYMGHAVGDVTDRYEGHDVTPYIPGDRGLLLDYVTRELLELGKSSPDFSPKAAAVKTC